MTSVPPDRRQAPLPEQLADWFQLNSRYVVIGLATIAAGVLGYWFYTSNAARNAQVAETQLLNARRSLASGNAQLAATDLRKVATTHKDTRAGVEAALLLSETLYLEGKYQEGIDLLRDFTRRGAAEVERAKIYSLIGDGLMQLGKHKDAADEYNRAAEAARFTGERAQQLAKRARALVVAGDSAAGRTQWESLADSEVPGIAAEARVRVGELTAAPVAAAQ